MIKLAMCKVFQISLFSNVAERSIVAKNKKIADVMTFRGLPVFIYIWWKWSSRVAEKIGQEVGSSWKLYEKLETFKMVRI